MNVRSAAVTGPIGAFVGMGVFWGTWAALLPEIKRATGATDGQLGLAIGLALTAALPAMLLTGRLHDRFGARLLPVTLVLLAFGALLPGLATSPGWLLVLLPPLGAASGATDVAMNADVAAAERTSGRRYMHGAHAFFSGSLLAGSLVTGVARALGAGRLAILAGAAAVILVTAVLARRDALGRPAVPPVDRARVPLSGPLVGLGVVCGLSFLIEGALESWSAIHLEDTLGAGPLVGSAAPALYAAAMVSGRALGQARAGGVAPSRLLLISGLVAAGGVALLAGAPGPALALLGAFIGGAGLSIAAPTVFSLTGRTASPAQEGSAISLVTTVGYVGFLVGPLLVGGVADGASLRWGLGVLVVLALGLAFGGRAVAAGQSASVGSKA